MIKTRYINENDKEVLKESLKNDIYHKDTAVDFFYDPRVVTNVYEDETDKPIMFVRGSKALRMDIQFMDNLDHKRNAKALLALGNRIIEQARKSGFNEMIFNTTNKSLAKFCKTYFGFEDSSGELRKFL